MLLNAYGWWTVATIALWAGYAMVLAGLLIGDLLGPRVPARRQGRREDCRISGGRHEAPRGFNGLGTLCSSAPAGTGRFPCRPRAAEPSRLLGRPRLRRGGVAACARERWSRTMNVVRAACRLGVLLAVCGGRLRATPFDVPPCRMR